MRNAVLHFWRWLQLWVFLSPLHVLLFDQTGAAGDITTKYGTVETLTITLASLATSSTRTAGRESTARTKTDPEVDFLISGKIRAGTSPTVGKQIDIWVYAEHDDTPTYPDVFDGTDSDETVTSENVRNSALRLLHSITIDSTTDRDYPFGPIAVAPLFGGVLPKRFGVFVTHDTAVNLNSTGGNHYIKGRPVYHNVAQS